MTDASMNLVEGDYYEFSFKQTYTSNIRQYRVSKSSTMTQFINDVKTKAYNDFEFDRHDTIMHIVEAGQFDNINGFAPELAPELVDSDMTIREKYSNIAYQVAFYIRVTVASIPHLIIVSQ